jgi:hypothetical protein
MEPRGKDENRETTLADVRLEVAVKNGTILGAISYFLGTLGGWTLSMIIPVEAIFPSKWEKGMFQAVAGFGVSVFLAALMYRVYWRGKGVI